MEFTVEKKRLLGNFFSLSILQGLNYILPLITVPYLVRVLGPEKFGLISFAQAFIQYFIIFTDYGFNLSATRKIAVCRDDKAKVSQVFNSVMQIKIILLLIGFLVMVLIVGFIPKFRDNFVVYLFFFGIVVGNVLFPLWFFQGIEDMKYITILNVVAKTIFTAAIFIFVKQRDDYFLVPAFNSLGFIIAGMASLIIVYYRFGIPFIKVKKDQLIEGLKDGWHIFISTMVTSLYTTSNTVILGLFTNNIIVGYYAAGEKIVRAALGMVSVISQTVYPYLNKIAVESRQKALAIIKKLTLGIGGVTFLISVFLLFFADSIVKVVLGDQYIASVTVLKILAFLPFIIGLSNVFGIQTMLIFQMNQAFSAIIIAGGLFNIVLALVLTPQFTQIGISISVLTTEILVTTTMYIYLQLKGINILFGGSKDV